MNDLDDALPSMLALELGSDPRALRPLDVPAVLHQGRRRRRVHRTRQGVLAALSVAAVATAFPLVHDHATGGSAVSAGPAVAPAGAAAPVGPAGPGVEAAVTTTDPVLRQLSDAVTTRLAPDTLTVLNYRHQDFGSDWYTVDGNLDVKDGKAASALTVTRFSAGPLAAGISCDDPEFVAGGTCSVTVLADGSSLTRTSHADGPGGGVLVSAHVFREDGSGISVEVVNREARTDPTGLRAAAEMLPRRIVRDDTPLTEQQVAALATDLSLALAP